MAATVDTAQRRPATAVRIARRVTVGGVRRLTAEGGVADARTEVVAAEHARTEAAVAAEHARTEAAEVVDILVAEAAMQEVAATPAAAIANGRDKNLDVSSQVGTGSEGQRREGRAKSTPFLLANKSGSRICGT